jgi:hypothetical protein
VTDKVITDELAERVERLLGEFVPVAIFVASGGAPAFVRRARELGIGIVDPNRSRFLVDETVHAGVLFRLHAAEAEVKRLSRGDVEEISGEFSE